MRVPSGCLTEYGPGLTGAPGLRGDAVPSGVSVVTSMTFGSAAVGDDALPDADGTAAPPAAMTASVRPPMAVPSVSGTGSFGAWVPLEKVTGRKMAGPGVLTSYPARPAP